MLKLWPLALLFISDFLSLYVVILYKHGYYCKWCIYSFVSKFENLVNFYVCVDFVFENKMLKHKLLELHNQVSVWIFLHDASVSQTG